MSKFACQNDTLDLVQFTGVVEKSLLGFRAYSKILVVSVWSATRVPWVPIPMGTGTGWLCPGWVAAPWLLHHGQACSGPSQWEKQVQNKCYLGASGCMWLAPKGSKSKWQNLIPWKSLCALYYPKIYGSISFSQSTNKSASVNTAWDSTLVVEFLWFNKTFFNFINIEYSPFTNLIYVYCDMANSNDLCTLIVWSFLK